MKWNVIRIHTTVEAEDYVASVLFELGFDGVEITDTVQLTEAEKKAMFIDFLPELDEKDNTAIITCYTEESNNVSERVAEIREAISEFGDFVDFGELTIETGITEDIDWINNWKKYFKSFRVDEDIIIKPTWEPMKEEYKDSFVVEIDPGTAFGTGSHETTKLVILNMKKYLHKGDRLLDIGTGSGILSIIGQKLGAGTCAATDIDPIAVDVAKDNAAVNGISVYEGPITDDYPGKIAFVCGNMLDDETFCKEFEQKKCRMVVANILADVIIPLAPLVKRFLTEDGIFISSGIINTKEQEVKETLLNCGYEILEVTHMKDWASFVVAMPAKKE